MKKYSVLVLFLFATVLVNAQDIKKELQLVQQAYQDLKSFEMDLKVEMLEGEHLVQTTYGRAAMKGSDYLSEYNGELVLLNDRCFLSVNHHQQSIVYNVRPEEKEMQNAPAAADPKDLVEQMLSDASYKYKIVASTDKTITIRTTSNNQWYEYIDMVIEKKRHVLVGMVYQYKQHLDLPYHTMRLDYTKVDLNIRLSDALFSEKSFVKKNGNTIRAAGDFSHYHLEDQSAYSRTERP